MKKTIAAIAITLALAGSAFAVDSQKCYKFDESTTICKFQPSGRVNVTTYYASTEDYFSDWYSKKEWPAALARLEKQKQLRDAKAHAYDCTLAQSRGETLSDCPAAPKDTTEECKKHYAAHPWYVVKEDGTKVIDAEAACKETK